MDQERRKEERVKERREMTLRDKITIAISIVALLASATVAAVGWIRADKMSLSNAEHNVISNAIDSESEARKSSDGALEKKLDGIQSTLDSVKTTSDKTRGMVEMLLDLMDGKLISGR